MTIRTFSKAFNGGEVTPEFFGRIDDPKYLAGVATMRNFIALPHGPCANRSGFKFVREVKTSSAKVRLIPFTYSTTQTMVIEMGAGYFRFHTAGGTLMNGGSPYEISNTYAEADLVDIHYVQSADVMTLVHPGYAPKELRRIASLNWTFTGISFDPQVTAPTAATTVANAPVGTGYTYTYQVTAIGADKISESLPATSNTVTNNIYASGASNTVSWTAAAGATRYRIYKFSAGVYGYIGDIDAAAVTFKDENVAPDLSRTPPTYTNPFNATGSYPAAVSYFEQRRCFAGTTNLPQTTWMSRTGTESDMSSTIPSRDDNSISFKIASREANTIRHLVPLNAMMILTSSTEWRASSTNDAITPSSINVKPQSFVGCSNVQPFIVNTNLIFGSARGGHVRELSYSFQANSYITGDLSLRAPHLFDNLDITDMAYAKSPVPICWFVSSNGKLLGMTYIPEQQVVAWHQHDTDGVFESIAVVAEGNEDVLYALVSRTINGSSKRYIERMQTRQFVNQADAFFVDCGLTYTGTPATNITGLSHLEGKTVSILADGSVHPRRVVTSGAITLDNAASTVQIGLPITADINTLPMALQIDNGMAQGRYKNVNKVWLRVYRSSGIFAGPNASELVEAKQRTSETYGTAPALKTEEVAIMLSPSWGDSGQVFIRQADPLPLTLVSMTMDVVIGG